MDIYLLGMLTCFNQFVFNDDQTTQNMIDVWHTCSTGTQHLSISIYWYSCAQTNRKTQIRTLKLWQSQFQNQSLH